MKKITLPEHGIIDFSSLSLERDLTEREQRFIFYYTFPGEYFMNQTKAAAKAGYRDSRRQGYQLRKNSVISSAVQQMLSSHVSINLEELYQKAMDMLDQRAFFNLADYTKQKTITIKVGKDDYKDIKVEVFKDLSELTPEQLKAVDGLDYKGSNGEKRVLVMADRGKTLSDIINMRNKINGLNDENDFDVEATADIIKGQLSVKVTARKNKEELSRSAGYMETPKEKAAEEL
jgi:phage terminase small subunit